MISAPLSLIAKRHRKRYPVTLISAYNSATGLVLCSDTEEQTAAYKGKIAKWFGLQAGDEYKIRVGGAGSAPAIDRFVQLHRECLKKLAQFDLEAILELTEKTMRQVYERYVWSTPHVDNAFHLLLAVQHHIDQWVFSIREDLIPQPHVTYVHAGSGETFATYLSERLYHTSLKLQLSVPLLSNVTELAVFITKQVKDSVPGVGGDTWLLNWNKDFSERPYSADETWEMEEEFKGFDDYLRTYWLSRGKR